MPRKKKQVAAIDEPTWSGEPAAAPAPARAKSSKDQTGNPHPGTVADVAVLHEFSTDGDLVDVWERRMLNPNQKPTIPIRLLTPGMKIRWINLANTGRYQRARYEEGWAPVHKSELKDEREIYGVSYTTEGWVCRGEKQSEMLMKIPEAVWKKICAAKYREVEKSRTNLKTNMQSAGSKHFGDRYNANRGDEIASALDNFKGDIKFGTERVEPDDEDFAQAAASIGE